MLNLIRLELFKTYAKWRTYIGFIAIGVLVPLVVWILHIDGGRMIQYQLRTLEKDFFITGNIFNGWFVAQFIMYGFLFHIPTLIALVAGDQLSGEATAGTFRLALIRPVSRLKFLNAKYIATLIYTASIVLFVAGFSVLLGLWIFGSGDLISFDPREGISILPESLLIGRFFLAYVLIVWAMFVVASLAFFFSSFIENAIGPIITTMVIMAIFLIISNLQIESVEGIKPYLFTTHMLAWIQALRDPIDWNKIISSSVTLGINSIIFYTATVIIFKRKDILS